MHKAVHFLPQLLTLTRAYFLPSNTPNPWTDNLLLPLSHPAIPPTLFPDLLASFSHVCPSPHPNILQWCSQCCSWHQWMFAQAEPDLQAQGLMYDCRSHPRNVCTCPTYHKPTCAGCYWKAKFIINVSPHSTIIVGFKLFICDILGKMIS